MCFGLVQCLPLFFSMNSIALRYKLSLCMATCAAFLAFGHNASALSVGDSHELGFLWPGAAIGNQNNVTYVNHLLGMALGGFDIANGQIYFLSNNTFSSLPTAVSPLKNGHNHKSWCRWRIHISVCELQRVRCRGLVCR